jgi:chaperonin GroEL
VGGATEAEVKERKDLVDDAFHATRAAVEEGVVAGGGVSFLKAIGDVKKATTRIEGDEKIGVGIVIRALEGPTRQIADNCGLDGAVVVDEILERGGKVGYDARTGEYVDMFKAGIIDPAKVARTALENAASVSSLMLTTELLLTDLKDEEKEIAGSVR